MLKETEIKDTLLIWQMKSVQFRLGFILLSGKLPCHQEIKPIPDEMAWELGIEATSEVGMFLSAFKMYLERK